jgi:hypothetical protein
MLEIGHVPEAHTVAIRAGDRLTDEDYEEAIPRLEEIIEGADGRISALILLDDLEGMDAGALWRDLKFAVRHRDDFDRVALVGGGRLEEVGGKTFGLLTSAEVERFPPDWLEDARHWVKPG